MDSDGFFRYEISFIIKRALSGDPLFCSLVIIFFMCPLIIVYVFNIHYERKYGITINVSRVLLFALYLISGMHIVGGLTNFVYLIGL